MFHGDTQFLIALWSGLTARGAIPHREDFLPEALGGRLARAFLLDGAGSDARFRLAGALLETLRDQPLSGRPFHDLWCDSSRSLTATALARTVREGRPEVIMARLEGVEVPAEVCIAPLRARRDGAIRVLGLLAVDEREVRRLAPLQLTARLSVAAGERRRPPLRLVAGRRSA